LERYPNINILLNLPQTYIPKAEFVLRTFCYSLRLNPKFLYGSHYEGMHLYYGPPTGRQYPIKIQFDPRTPEFFEQRELYPLDQVNFCPYKKENIPFLFSLPGPIFSFDKHCVIFRKDIVASAFYFLTCWHEYILASHGQKRSRVDFRQSLQYRWDFTDVPVVDVYCQMLLYVMGLHLPQFIRDISWNQNKRFCLSLSHDIDYWNYWGVKQQASAFRYNVSTLYKRPLNALYKILGHTIHKNLVHDPWRVMRKLARREADKKIKSTWFLFGRDDFEDPRQNYISDVKVREQIIDLLGQQEVGLHGSPESAFDAGLLVSELAKLRELGFDPIGYRSHYLNFDYQNSFSILEEAGIKYDSTLGYWEHIGFRAGFSLPFHPFNIKENRPFRILEIPLIVMDTTLYSKKAMDLSLIDSRRSLRRLIDLAAKYQSHLSLLWHNTTFDPIDYPLWASLYWDTISYAMKKKAWITSLHDVYEEWVTLSY
jgi:hypothetical protein